MKYILAHVRHGKMIAGDTLADLLSTIDYTVRERTVWLFGRKDTVSYTLEYTDEELAREARQRVLELLGKQGWSLYKNVKEF